MQKEYRWGKLLGSAGNRRRVRHVPRGIRSPWMEQGSLLVISRDTGGKSGWAQTLQPECPKEMSLLPQDSGESGEPFSDLAQDRQPPTESGLLQRLSWCQHSGWHELLETCCTKSWGARYPWMGGSQWRESTNARKVVKRVDSLCGGDKQEEDVENAQVFRT